MLGLASGLSGGSALADPFSKFGVTFDGTDEFVNFGDENVFSPNASGANRGFSISAWVNFPEGNPQGKKFLTKADQFSSGFARYEWSFTVDFAKRFKFQLFNKQLNDSKKIIFRTVAGLPTDRWVNIVFSYDLSSSATASGSFVVHINGVKHSVALGNATISGNNSFEAHEATVVPMFMGRGGSTHTSQTIDEVALFDDALDDDQAISIYNNGQPGDLSDISHLIGWWRMGDTAGRSVHPTLEDFSSNDNSGTMTNMAQANITEDIA